MAIADSPSIDSARVSPALVVAIRSAGVSLPAYGDHPDLPLGAEELRILDSLVGGTLDVDRPGARALLAALDERGLLRDGDAHAGTTAPPPVVPAVSDRVVDLSTDEVVLPTPLLVGCGPEGFDLVDHDGVVRARLDADELLVAAAFRVPCLVDEARSRLFEEHDALVIDAGGFDAVVRRLVAGGLLIPFDPRHPEQARRTRQAEMFRDGLRRLGQIHANFDRLEAEQDARGGAAERVRVIGFHSSWSILPAALGMVLASLAAHQQGILEESYDFRPRLLWDDPRLARAADGPPAIFLFSNYIWSSSSNLPCSALVKERNPHHITVHGGPDTPKYEGDVERFFADHPHVDVAVHGEGEHTFAEMLEALRDHVGEGPPDLSVLADVPGLSFRSDHGVVRSGPRDRVADLDSLPSPVLMGLYEGFVPAGTAGGGLNIETNRGCPYGCTFCDWGSATLSRVRKFDLDRVFAELEWCAVNGFKVAICDANFGIFERDVDIAQRISDLKAVHGYPRFVGTNYAKNTVKHLSKIIEIFTEAGIVAEGKLSMQTFDEETLTTIRRKNIKVEKYHDLSVEFRHNDLPLSVDLMMGLPGATPESFRNDLQSCIDRDLRAIVHTTVLLANSPMNDPAYRAENEIVALPGEEVRQSASFTRREWEQMDRLRTGFWLFENFGILRQVGTYVRSETAAREVDFYERFVEDALTDPDQWPSMAITLRVLPGMMVPPVSWRTFVDEVHRYLVDRVGIADDAALRTVLEVQHALLPARDRSFPWSIELDHDYVAWHALVAARREEGEHTRWHEQVPSLREHGPAVFSVDDPLDSCQRSLGPSYVLLSEDSAWDLASSVSRPRQAEPQEKQREKVGV